MSAFSPVAVPVANRAVTSAARKYASVAGIAVRQSLSERSALLGRMGFYALILFIFSRLWEVVGERAAIPGVTMKELLWYLALTEWVMLSLPLIHLQIESDVRRGDIAYRLPRPISYLGARFAEAVGDFVVRAVSLGVAGFVLAYAMAGGLPKDPTGLLLAVPLVALAAWVGICFHAAIGLTAIWLQDSSPVYWIWQKAAFILGGLMLPLEVYPAWLREVAMWTPFSALMHGPGRMAFGWQPEYAAMVAVKLIFWGVVASLLVTFVYRRGLRALDVNGG
jgi:ABC-2 type transport system permease protein